MFLLLFYLFSLPYILSFAIEVPCSAYNINCCFYFLVVILCLAIIPMSVNRGKVNQFVDFCEILTGWMELFEYTLDSQYVKQLIKFEVLNRLYWSLLWSGYAHQLVFLKNRRSSVCPIPGESSMSKLEFFWLIGSHHPLWIFSVIGACNSGFARILIILFKSGFANSRSPFLLVVNENVVVC